MDQTPLPLLLRFFDWLSDLRLFDLRSYHAIGEAIENHAASSGFYLVLGGVAMVIAMGWIRWLIGLVLGGTSLGSMRVVAERFALGLRRRESAASMAASLRATLPLVLGLRIRRVASNLASGRAASLVAALTQQRLLPARILALAASAETLGADVLAAVFGVVGLDALMRERLGRRFVPTTASLIMILLLGCFIGTFIMPKFEVAAWDLGIVGPPHASTWTWCMDHLLTIETPALIVLMCAGCLVGWMVHWRSHRRRIAAEIVLAASAARIDEHAIAKSLGLDGPMQGFAAVCQATGWSARDPSELARAVRRWQERLDRRRIVLATLFEILAPVLLGVLVFLMVTSIFGFLVQLIYAEAQVC